MSFEDFSHKKADPLTIDEATKGLLIAAQAQGRPETEADGKEKYFERVYVAGELSELGINARLIFSDEDVESIKNDIKRFRSDVLEGKAEVIGLVKYLYRLRQVGLSWPPLNAREKKLLQDLPDEMRLFPDYGSLMYLPQLAEVSAKDISDIKKPGDLALINRYLEAELAKGGDHELHTMMLAGTLADFDTEALRALVNSEAWHDDRWPEVLALLEQYKKAGDGYRLARLLPSARKVNKARN